MRISDWSSDVCSSDLLQDGAAGCRSAAKGTGEHPAADRIARNASPQEAQEITGRPGVPPSGSRAAPRASCRIAALRLLPLTPSALPGLRAPLAPRRVCALGGWGRSCCSLHPIKIGRAHLLTPITNSQLLC